MPSSSGQPAAALEGLAAHQAHELGVLPEELEAGVEHPIDLRPAVDRRGGAVSSSRRNQSASDDSNTSWYSASLEGKWYSRLGRRIPTSAAMSLSDVPS